MVCDAFERSPIDFRNADNKYPAGPFDGICREVLSSMDKMAPRQLFDAILVDEAQDLPRSFFRMIYRTTRRPHRVIFAYDDLQNLGDYEMPSERELFGDDKDGDALVTLRNDPDQPKEDIVLPVCYRNTPWALASAHALGFGIYRKEGLVQMFEEPSIWPRIGYEVERGSLELGASVRVKRRSDSYPGYFLTLLSPDDAILAETFETEAHQYEKLASDIRLNIDVDELEFEDILIVVPDAWSSKKVGARIMGALAKIQINSHLVGVTSSRDEVFRPNSIAITHIYRAKGNEAPMVYFVNADYCQSGFELNRKRNVFFTGITRSRCWVRIFGVGNAMRALSDELSCVRSENFELSFKYPDQDEIAKMARVHRDMTSEERQDWKQKLDVLKDVARAVADGEVSIESLPTEIRELMKRD